jgi:hypothetical protein
MKIHLKDGQEPPKTINYSVGRMQQWKFENFAKEDMESLYKRRKYTKTRIMFSDGSDNHLLTLLAKRDGKKFPKKDHWVNVYGYTIMPVVWKPSGRIKFALYTSRDKTLYDFVRTHYPQGSWMSDVPKWVKGK